MVLQLRYGRNSSISYLEYTPYCRKTLPSKHVLKYLTYNDGVIHCYNSINRTFSLGLLNAPLLSQGSKYCGLRLSNQLRLI